MFANRILKSAVLVAAVLLAASAAQAQQTPASNQVQVSPTKTVDILNARFVSIAPGASYVVDRNGATHAAVFQNVQAVTFADGFKNYIAYGAGGVYLNLSQTTSVECSGSASIVTWGSGTPTVLQDGCAFSDYVKAYARR